MTEPLPLRTHTSLWRIERRLHRIGDINLPVPVSLRQIGVVLVVGLPWIFLMRLLNVPFAPPFGHVFWIAPPVLAAWYANKPVAEGKTFLELLLSQARYLLQARHYARLRPFTPNRQVRARAQLWHRGQAPTRTSWQAPRTPGAALSATTVPAGSAGM